MILKGRRAAGKYPFEHIPDIPFLCTTTAEIEEEEESEIIFSDCPPLELEEEEKELKFKEFKPSAAYGECFECCACSASRVCLFHAGAAPEGAPAVRDDANGSDKILFSGDNISEGVAYLRAFAEDNPNIVSPNLTHSDCDFHWILQRPL